MRRELSGHDVYVLPFLTIKTGDGTVLLQGQAMDRIRSHCPSIAPRVWAFTETGYIMSTLRELRTQSWDWRVAEGRLAANVWCLAEHLVYGYQPEFDISELHDFLDKHGTTEFFNVVPSSPYLKMRYGNVWETTHGDPTHENTMQNKDGSYCLIDWQPFRRPFLPPNRAVDYGKLLQSVLGWMEPFSISNDQYVESRFLFERCHDAWFWCAINYMRIKKRTSSPELKEYCDKRIEFLIHLKRKAA